MDRGLSWDTWAAEENAKSNPGPSLGPCQVALLRAPVCRGRLSSEGKVNSCAICPGKYKRTTKIRHFHHMEKTNALLHLLGQEAHR